ncbi:hypothetical protein VP496E541_P0140 [Vibrio phage 496E54-1]|nr:hypothetical protein VP495E541_P0139 [Vibrio phage 495E54-1]CAH9013932.1 hypothetical protein VP496E541_P0140 [Vibrio phage 496E54-1]
MIIQCWLLVSMFIFKLFIETLFILLFILFG